MNRLALSTYASVWLLGLSIGLPLGLEAPVMTPDSVSFLLFSAWVLNVKAVLIAQMLIALLPMPATEHK